MAESLSQRRLLLSYLQRQMLLERQPLKGAEAVRRLSALQAQYSPSPYIALRARLTDFEVDDLEQALQSGTVVKSSLMRGTLHLVDRDDYGAFAVAWRQQWLNDLRSKYRTVSLDEAAVAEKLDRFARKPRTADEIRDKMGELCPAGIQARDYLHWARALVPCTHLFPSGGWRQHRQFSLEAWPAAELPSEPAATARLIRSYLTAFGPATREDIAHFSYLKYRQLDPALAELGDELHRRRSSTGAELLDVLDGPIIDDADPPVRFLAKWDAAVISHKDRTRILPAEFHQQVVKTINGDVLPTYLVDGTVAGTWAIAKKKNEATIELSPFTKITAKVRKELEAEALDLLAFAEPEASSRSFAVLD